jgi:hypothetical protein
MYKVRLLEENEKMYLQLDLEKVSSLIDEVLGWVDSGSLEANKLLEARNLVDRHIRNTTEIEAHNNI